MWIQVLTIILGLFLMFAPSAWSFDKAASDHHYIIGPLIITTAIIALWEINRGLRWMNVVIGAWMLVSPLVLKSNETVATIDVVCAILLILFSLFKGTVKHRYGGGWSSLIQKNPMHVKEVAEYKH